MNLRLDEQASADAAVVENWTKGAEPLLALKQKLRPTDVPEGDKLSPEQLQLVKESLDGIDKAADGTPFAALAGVIRRDVTAGQQREVAVADMAKKFVGRPAPPIAVTPLEGGSPASR